MTFVQMVIMAVQMTMVVNHVHVQQLNEISPRDALFILVVFDVPANRDMMGIYVNTAPKAIIKIPKNSMVVAWTVNAIRMDQFQQNVTSKLASVCAKMESLEGDAINANNRDRHFGMVIVKVIENI